MNINLIPFRSEEGKELFKGVFMVPADWKSCGVVVHISGGNNLQSNQPVALAITGTALSFCDQNGPISSIHLQSLSATQVVDLSGIAIPVNTPSGVIDMVPTIAKGVSITYQLSPMGNHMELILYMLSPRAAYEWVNTIQRAIQRNAYDFDSAGEISHRED